MNLFLDLFFPKKCIGCKSAGVYLCQSCVQEIKQADLVCPQCERASIGGQAHPVCQRKFGLDGLWSLGVYQALLKEAIQRLKYSGIPELAVVLTEVVVEYWAKHQPYLLDQLRKNGGRDWVVVPVPLHWYRKNWRGFNQSSLFGQTLSKQLGLGYCEAIKRIRYTNPQARLLGKNRRQNIRNAFEIVPSYNPQTIPCVLLIDDVWTTGSTLKECCYVLKRAGVKKVWAITLAR